MAFPGPSLHRRSEAPGGRAARLGVRALVLLCLGSGGPGCAGDDHGDLLDARASDAGASDAGASDASPDTSGLPYARGLVLFTPGEGAGFGQRELPDIVLGPPAGKGPLQAGLDVVSLGVGGEIALSFGTRIIIDGPGPDLIVFENPFWVGGEPSATFAELGEVSISADMETWHTWLCDTEGDGQGRWPGCAGWSPTLEYDPFQVVPLDPLLTGGDAFDLSDLGVTEARFVRIRDLSKESSAPQSAGFDLDAIGVIHWREQESDDGI